MFNYKLYNTHKKYTNTSFYLTVRDDTRLAIDLFLPEPISEKEKIPSIVRFTRYWRYADIRKPFKLLFPPKPMFSKYGYAELWVDVRGSGASSGYRPHPWSDAEIKDCAEVFDWVISQSWSNGNIGVMGNSYVGTIAELSITNHHPAVKAVIPQCNLIDSYSDLVFPGGVFNEWFIRMWSGINQKMDRGLVPKFGGIFAKLAVKGVKPVDGDKSGHMRKNFIAEHRHNNDVYKLATAVTYRDDKIDLPYPKDSTKTVTIDDFSVHSRLDKVNSSNVPVCAFGGWFDAGVSDTIIKRFLNYNHLKLAVIAPLNHGLIQNTSTFAPNKRNTYKTEIESEKLRFFDYYMKNPGSIENNPYEHKTLIYYTIGEEKWKLTHQFPVKNTDYVKLYLRKGHKLHYENPPTNHGSDVYKVNYQATTGKHNRWHTQLNNIKVFYPDRRKEDAKLITYTTNALDNDIEMTGYPLLNLYLSSSCCDGAVFAYLEDIDEKGRVHYITEGILRFMHRNMSEDYPPYKMITPYHSFNRVDAHDVTPYEPMCLRFAMFPMSVLFKKGHRIRLAIAGHDRDTFIRIPPDEQPEYQIYRGFGRASFIELPIVHNSS